jgi:hypothetical protein
MIHELKTAPEYFEAVISGEKSFEVRKNDRSFKKGDLLALNEFDRTERTYSGRSCLVYIDYILNDPVYCKDSYVVMSIKPCLVHRYGCPIDIRRLAEDYRIPLATDTNEIRPKMHPGER